MARMAEHLWRALVLSAVLWWGGRASIPVTVLLVAGVTWQVCSLYDDFVEVRRYWRRVDEWKKWAAQRPREKSEIARQTNTASGFLIEEVE